MTYQQFGLTYSMFEDQLQAISDALTYLNQRELSGAASEQADILRLEAELNRKEGQIQRQFDLFKSSSIAVTPPATGDATSIEGMMNQVEALTSSAQLVGATLTLINNLADSVTPLLT